MNAIRTLDPTIWSCGMEFATSQEMASKDFISAELRSENEGLRRFKLGWGAVEEPIEYFRFDMRNNDWTASRDRTSGFHNGLLEVTTGRQPPDRRNYLPAPGLNAAHGTLYSPGQTLIFKISAFKSCPSQKPIAQPSGLNLQDILYVLFRHKWKIIISSTIGFCAATAVYLALSDHLRVPGKIACAICCGYEHNRSG